MEYGSPNGLGGRCLPESNVTPFPGSLRNAAGLSRPEYAERRMEHANRGIAQPCNCGTVTSRPAPGFSIQAGRLVFYRLEAIFGARGA